MEKAYNGEYYTPTPFMADNDEIAAKYRRVLLRHKGKNLDYQAELIIAEKGIISSGWVIGFIKD